MPAPLLLQSSWPAVHPVLMTLLGVTLTALATWFWTTRTERRTAKAKAAEAAKAAEEKRLADVAEAARKAEAEKHEWEAWCGRVKALEQLSDGFMPENNIREELHKLGRDIADNQAKIKTQHDRGEDAVNALNQRVSTMEHNHAALTLLPGEVITLKTDHRVLAAEVRALAGSVDKLGEKQDKHFGELMNAVREAAYTRGELHAGQRRPPYELPPS